MNTLSAVNKYTFWLKNPILFSRYLLRIIAPFIKDDEQFIKYLWKLHMDYPLNLENPQTFSEKLQWLKLYYHNPEYTIMVDKNAVKKYVANIIGSEYVIPTIGIWEKPEDIDWNKLPNQFVLKCTHDSGGLVICRDKSKLDKKSAVNKLRKCLNHDYYMSSREWPYKNVPRRIIAEKYIAPDSMTNDLPDYKFFCFNGEPEYCQVISGRGTKMCIDFFDLNWNHQSFHEPRNYPFAEFEPVKPMHFDLMLSAARKLASGKPFSRIDFYDIRDNVYFGEITFFPTSGIGGFNPQDKDKEFGDMIYLPAKWI